LRAGWLTALAGSSAALYWLAVPVHDIGGLPWMLAAPCALAVGAYVGLYGGLFAAFAHALRERPAFARCLAFGLCWFLLEYLRGVLFTGFPWLVLSAAFVPWTPVIQAAAYIGSYALSGLLAAIACLAIQGPERKFCMFSAVFLALCLVLGGAARLKNATAGESGRPNARHGAFAPAQVVLVQGNVDQNQKWDPAYQKTTLERYLRLSEAAAADGPALLIWPETAMPFYFQSRPDYADRIRAFARRHNAALLLGAPGHDAGNPETRRVFNRAFLVDAEGGDAGFYDKKHLVPFGEYLPPWLDYPALAFLFQGVGAFAAGTSELPLRSGRLALGVLICYETIFPESAQARVAEGANLLVNISNDAWFGDTSAPEQHLQLSVLRAVEQGRWLARATNSGFSAFVDPMGRIRARGMLMREEALAGFVRPEEDRTVFHGLFPGLHYVAAILLLPAALCRSRKTPPNP
jgi:apolipoprotein N-acyltransferase